jgi:hypothetical protein
MPSGSSLEVNMNAGCGQAVSYYAAAGRIMASTALSLEVRLCRLRHQPCLSHLYVEPQDQME